MDAGGVNQHDCKCISTACNCTNNVDTLAVEPVRTSRRLSNAILSNRENSEISLRFNSSAGDGHGGRTRELSGGGMPSNSMGNYSKVQLGRALQNAVNNHEWSVGERLVTYMSDSRRLNDGLCTVLDSIWFLNGQHEIGGAIGLMERLVEAGARDFSRGSLRTSFLASCVSVCKSCALSLSDTVSVIAERLRERLVECNNEELVKAEAASKVQRFTEWALKCIGSHCRRRGRGGAGEGDYGILRSSTVESHLQLLAFRRFMELAGDRLTAKDCTEAFDAACFPLTLFSSDDPGWASGIAATVIQGLLQMLMEFGADNIKQCFLEAARFGSTELVRMLLQIARRNSVDLDVDLALRFAARYSKITTMECLVVDGNADSFLGPLMRASERGCMETVQWFVRRGCKEMELCLALTAALSNSRLDVVIFLLEHVPKHSLVTLSEEILTAAGERSSKALQGIAYLLEVNFLDDCEATYGIADRIANSDDEGVAPELKAFLKQEWSEEAFKRGISIGREHYINVIRAIRRGSSSLCLKDLPMQLQVAIAYLPLYNECIAINGELLPQSLRGQLVEAALRLSNLSAEELSVKSTCKRSLLSILESRLPSFFTKVALKV